MYIKLTSVNISISGRRFNNIYDKLHDKNIKIYNSLGYNELSKWYNSGGDPACPLSGGKAQSG
ncbi:MAG: hypothetical protein LBV68_07940 [Spirochaetaceae bacterium]|jgi:hypothetical protein|nr:hypothetical protein [Spirochaetaceae bacterium]